jgi:hypothetical protein
LEALVATQTDESHLRGVVHLLEDLEARRRANATPELEIGTVWSNIPRPAPSEPAPSEPAPSEPEPSEPAPGGRAETTSTRPRFWKGSLPVIADRLSIPLNHPFDRFVSMPVAGAASINIPAAGPDTISVTVLSPRGDIDQFLKYWHESVRRLERGEGLSLSPYDRGPSTQRGPLETFSNPLIRLRPSATRIPAVPPGQGTDRSVINRSSIAMMVEFAGRRILLTSDARDVDLLEALRQGGYVGRDGKAPVDLLALPHGGSLNNVSPGFFETVPARHYLFSVDGTFGWPKAETLAMITGARPDDEFTIHFTNREGREDLAERIRSFSETSRRSGRKFRINIRDDTKPSLIVDLMAPVQY